MYAAKLTNGKWTRYYESWTVFSSIMPRVEYSCGAKVFDDGEFIGYYAPDGIIPSNTVRSYSDAELHRAFWPFESVEKIRRALGL